MMKRRKKAAAVAIAITAMALVGATSASATTLEVGGVVQNASVTYSMSLVPDSSSITETTSGSSSHTCTVSQIHGSTSSPFTGTKVTGPVTTMTFENCTRAMTVHNAGKLWFEHITGTTNATVFSEETDVTKGTVFGTLTCTTGAGTHIGTLTGAAAGHATLDVKAVLNCGVLVPSMLWTATYTVTSPLGLGVVS